MLIRKSTAYTSINISDPERTIYHHHVALTGRRIEDPSGASAAGHFNLQHCLGLANATLGSSS